MDINILVAEDDDDIRVLLDIHLSKEGFRVFKAHDGVEALHILSRENIYIYTTILKLYISIYVI